MQADINLPVMIFTTFIAALFQDMLPLTEMLPVKIVFLTAIALFYIITRPFIQAIAVVLWAGMLTDALGGLPMFCTVGFLLLAYGAVHLSRSMIYSANILTGIILCAGLSCAQMIWTQLWAGSAAGADIWYGVALLGYSVIAGAIAGGVGFALCLLVDNLSGCIKPTKEKNGFSWTKAD